MAESAFNIGDIQGQIKGLSDQIGTLSSLTTTAKTSAVAAINEVNNKFAITSQTTGITVTMANCTATYTNNNVWCERFCNDQMLYIRILKRGNITAVGSGNPYSILTVTGINISAYNTSKAICGYRELSTDMFVSTVGNVICSGNNSDFKIQIQLVGGLTANQWKVKSGFYLDVYVLLMK